MSFFIVFLSFDVHRLFFYSFLSFLFWFFFVPFVDLPFFPFLVVGGTVGWSVGDSVCEVDGLLLSEGLLEGASPFGIAQAHPVVMPRLAPSVHKPGPVLHMFT